LALPPLSTSSAARDFFFLAVRAIRPFSFPAFSSVFDLCVSKGWLLRKLSSRGVQSFAVVADLLDQALSLVFRDAVLSREVLELVALAVSASGKDQV
jgi:hypothetical protein